LTDRTDFRVVPDGGFFPGDVDFDGSVVGFAPPCCFSEESES
jgi:hypothetical protein